MYTVFAVKYNRTEESPSDRPRRRACSHFGFWLVMVFTLSYSI